MPLSAIRLARSAHPLDGMGDKVSKSNQLLKFERAVTLSDNPENLPTIRLSDPDPKPLFKKGQRFRKEVAPGVFFTLTQIEDPITHDAGKQQQPSRTDEDWRRAIEGIVGKFDMLYRDRVMDAALSPKFNLSLAMSLQKTRGQLHSPYFREVEMGWSSFTPTKRAECLYNLANFDTPGENPIKVQHVHKTEINARVTVRPKLSNVDTSDATDSLVESAGDAFKRIIKDLNSF